MVSVCPALYPSSSAASPRSKEPSAQPYAPSPPSLDSQKSSSSSAVDVTFARYAAVFPLSETINLLHKHEEIPHWYQMMLEVLDIRTRVEDEATSPRNDEFGLPTALHGRNGRHRHLSEWLYSPRGASKFGSHHGHEQRSYNHQYQH